MVSRPLIRSPFLRSESDRYLSGVAGGLGRRFVLDPFFVRIGFVAVTLLASTDNDGLFVLPLVLYLAAWLLVPTTSNRSLVMRALQRPAQQEIVGAFAVFILAIVVIENRQLIWAGALLAIAAMLLGGRTVPDAPADTSGTGDPPPPVDDRMKPLLWGRSLRGLGRPDRADEQQPPPRPRRSPALWPLTLALLFGWWFAAALLDNLVNPGVDPGLVVSGSLLIIGGVVALSGWRGRAWSTLLLLIPLAPAWVAFSVADIPRFDDTAQAAIGPSGLSDGDVIKQSRGYGGLVLQLDEDDLPESGEVTAQVDLTAGQIDVYVPKEADLHIVGSIGLGMISVYEERFYWSGDGEELLADYGLNRRYNALGRECYTNTAYADELYDVADWSGVDIPRDATPDELADAIEAEGYPRPVQSHRGVETIPLVNEFGEQLYDEVTGEPRWAEEPTFVWEYQINENFGLCIPEDPPENPVLITIDATVGLGELKVHRV